MTILQSPNREHGPAGSIHSQALARSPGVYCDQVNPGTAVQKKCNAFLHTNA